MTIGWCKASESRIQQVRGSSQFPKVGTSVSERGAVASD